MSETEMDLGGLTLVVKGVKVGATAPGHEGATETHSITAAATSPLVASYSAPTAAASVDGSIFTTTTNVTLGTYANAMNAKLDFSTTGAVTGLGGVACAELDLSASCTAGSYACFEAELNVPTGAKTGTRTSFLTLNVWGADVATFDTNGFIFDISGVTAGAGKVYRAGLSQAVTATARLRVQVAGVTYYIPLCVNEALTS